MLVDYSSASDSGSPPPQPKPKAALPPVAGPASDGDDSEVDPTDGFGINNLEKDRVETRSNSQVVAVRSAPAVLVNVSRAVPSAKHNQVLISALVDYQDPYASSGGSTSLVTRPSDQIVFFNPTYEVSPPSPAVHSPSTSVLTRSHRRTSLVRHKALPTRGTTASWRSRTPSQVRPAVHSCADRRAGSLALSWILS